MISKDISPERHFDNLIIENQGDDKEAHDVRLSIYV